MNRATRVLLMSGVAVAAGMAFSAPAMAATSAPSPAGHSTQVAPRHTHTWSEGHYRSFLRCRAEGHHGIWSGDWDYYRCVPGHGRYRGTFELIVTENVRGGWGGNGGWDNGNGGWNNGNGGWDNGRPGGWDNGRPGGEDNGRPGGWNGGRPGGWDGGKPGNNGNPPKDNPPTGQGS